MFCNVWLVDEGVAVCLRSLLTYIYRVKCYYFGIMAMFIVIVCVYLSHLLWYGGVVKGVLQYVGCLGEGQGPSWANVEGWQSSTFPQAPTRVACSLGKG